jgi:hypothetical protein
LSHRITLRLHEGAGARPVQIEIDTAVIAGWTGRDQQALEKHIIELEALGVARPATTPIFYRVAASRLTTAPEIEVSGDASSGEVEFLLVKHGGQLLVGVGSDHTDRRVETYDVTVSKQMCDKPIAGDLWRYDDVRPHWDALRLQSWADDILYQDGHVTVMRSPEDLLERLSAGGADDGTLMFCGTLGAIGGIRPARSFRYALHDPILGRTIEHCYTVTELPVLG